MPCISVLILKGFRFVVLLRTSNGEEIITPMSHAGPNGFGEVFTGTNKIKVRGQVVLAHVERRVQPRYSIFHARTVMPNITFAYQTPQFSRLSFSITSTQQS
jgi:hypothetical protein